MQSDADAEAENMTQYDVQPEILTPIIAKLVEGSATLGLSVGMLHQGEIVHKCHFGRRGLNGREPPDDETTYYVASLTKAVTAAAASILVDQAKLDWQTPVCTWIPEFKARDDQISREASLIDFLSHRTGLTKSSGLWYQRRQIHMMPKEETINTLVHLTRSASFRQGFVYNNWGYGMVEAAIEKVSGMSFTDFLSQNLFKPLRLERTTVGTPKDGNTTSANTNWDDGSVCPLKEPPQTDETGLAAAGAMKTSLSDLLLLYKALLATYKAEQEHNHHDSTQTDPETPSSPFRNVTTLFTPQIAINNDINHGYALGWVRTVLPHTLSTTSLNSLYLGSDLPVIGTTSPGTSVLHHSGNYIGTQSSVHMIPATRTAIVVLSNTLGLTDTADWVGQLLLQSILGEEPHDYVAWSEKAKAGLLKQYADLSAQLEAGRTFRGADEHQPTTSPESLSPSPLSPLLESDLEPYCGRYVNRAGNFTLDISVSHTVPSRPRPATTTTTTNTISTPTDTSEPSGLCLSMKIQNHPDVVYHLFPYDLARPFTPASTHHSAFPSPSASKSEPVPLTRPDSARPFETESETETADTVQTVLDTFYWPVDREIEMCVEMMFPWTWLGIHLVQFHRTAAVAIAVTDDEARALMGLADGARVTKGRVDRLSWQYDPAIEAESFTRVS